MTRPLTRCIQLGFLLAALLGTTAASLASDAVLATHVESTALDADQRASLDTRVAAKLAAYPELATVSGPTGDLTEEMISLECVDIDLACLIAIGRKYGAGRVIYSQVDTDTSTGGYTLFMRAVDVGVQKYLLDETVPAADVDAVAAVVDAQLLKLLGPPPAADPPGTLVVETPLPTATIQVGSEYAGTGTATLELPAGTHTVRVSHEGYVESLSEVVITSGETLTHEVTLVAAGGGSDPGTVDDDDDGGSVALWVILGAVVVGGAVTAIVLATDGESPPRAHPVLSIDRANAWRDVSVLGGRP